VDSDDAQTLADRWAIQLQDSRLIHPEQTTMVLN
jgi:hypothetical protein